MAPRAAGTLDTIERVATVAVFLASGKADVLSGRFIHVHSDVEALVSDAERIQKNDYYTLRLREPPH